MMNPASAHFNFQAKAREEMIHDGFQPDFPPQVMAEVNSAQAADVTAGNRRDLRALLWSSIDNDESRDFDQVEWAERLPNGNIRVLVGIADVDAVVKKGSAADRHAAANATSVYTGGPVFSMLPERLSTDLTSLGQDVDRAAVVMEFVAGKDGAVVSHDVYQAVLRNKARLAYNQVAQWLQNVAPAPLDDQVRVQNEASALLKEFRRQHGSLTLGGVESVPVIVNNEIKRFENMQSNPARDIIENFMVAANEAMARFLRDRNSLCLRRIVRTPKRWDRIQAIAAQLGTTLPKEPDSRALNEFLSQRKQADPEHFPDLSLSVLKSMGPGEYVVEHPGSEHEGHFGLAVDDYTHSTAPNRRYADLVMQRLLKASISQSPCPYSEAELSAIAAHCTERESAARHVERFMKKVAAAIMLQSQIGQIFDAIVTGVTPQGTYARLLTVPAEGRIVRGEKGLDIGNKVRVRLLSTDPNKGFIDLAAGDVTPAPV
ncbi:MAG TPA: RNB domain-containing ribonuclease [Candidatus Saccharimonadales bacterium]|nr:RNB domain-containing ribonuclease [Candidatus Saccharimonadales bacterium]